MADPIKLFETADRNEAHGYLAETLTEGLYPEAECREDANAEMPYQVWSGSIPTGPREGQQPDDALSRIVLTDAERNAVADFIAQRRRGN